MNKVILMGRLTHDVDLRQTPSGNSVARISIAINRRTSKDKEQQADFINCEAWKQTAEFISRYFHKGSMIAICGHLKSSTWEKDGQKHYSTDVVIDEVYFTGSKNKTNNSTTSEQSDDFGDCETEDDEDCPF